MALFPDNAIAYRGGETGNIPFAGSRSRKLAEGRSPKDSRSPFPVSLLAVSETLYYIIVHVIQKYSDSRDAAIVSPPPLSLSLSFSLFSPLFAIK